MNIRALAMMALLAAAVCASRAAEDSTSSSDGKDYLPWEKGFAKVGGFITTFSSSLSFGLENAPGVRINAEQELGLDSSLSVFRAGAMYRPGKSLRHQLDFDYASYHRSGEATLSHDLTIDGITYPVGAQVNTTFNFDIIRGDYTYAVWQDQRVRVGIGLGVYAVPLKYGLNIQTMNGRSSVEGADTTIPLPTLALRAEFQVIPKLYLNGTLDGMYLEVGGFRGSILDATVGVEYRLWKHLGLGAAYSYMGAKVSSENTSTGYPEVNFVGSVDVHFSGVLLYGKFSF